MDKKQQMNIKHHQELSMDSNHQVLCMNLSLSHKQELFMLNKHQLQSMANNHLVQNQYLIQACNNLHQKRMIQFLFLKLNMTWFFLIELSIS